VIVFNISHPSHIFSVTFTSRHLPKTLINNVKVKAKQSRYRLGEPRRVPGILGNVIPVVCAKLISRKRTVYNTTKCI